MAFQPVFYRCFRSAPMLSMIAAGIVATPAGAQLDPARTAPNALENAAKDMPPSGLEEVIVTARKRAESVQDIPVSVSAISAEQIQRLDLTSLEKVAATTPQFSAGRASNGSGAQLTLRGIGSSSTSIGIEQSVAVVVDSVYYGQGRIINEGFFDLSRVEILKGPQALFFGKNATAGVISLTTADPGSTPEFLARTGYEFHTQQVTGELVGSGPLSDTLGLRVAVRYSKMFDGYFKNDADPFNYSTFDVASGNINDHLAAPSQRNVPGEEELLSRVTLKWEPTSEFTATLKATVDGNDTNVNAWNYVLYRCPTGRSSLNPAHPCSTRNFVIYQNDTPADIASVTPYMGEGNYNRYHSWGVTGALDYQANDFTVTSVTNYNFNRNKFDCHCAFSESGIWTSENASFDAFSSELRAVTTFDGPLNIMVGAYYQQTKRKLDQYTAFAGLEDSSMAPSRQYAAYQKSSATDGKTLAGFGQVTWKFLPELEATAGARYTHETKDSFFVQPYVNAALQGLFNQGGYIHANQTFDNWSPEATISWKLHPGVNVYAAYKTAYKSGGFSNSGIYSALSTTAYDDFAFEPEKAKGFEAGLKATLFDRQLRFNVGLFRYKYTNLQVDFFNSPIFAFQTINAGSAITKGFETELEYAPRAWQGLTLRGSLNYTKARYGDFLAPCYTGETPAQGCTLVGPGGAPFQQLHGRPTAVAPDWTATLGAGYETPIRDALIFDISVDARYSGDYLASGFAEPLSQVDSYTTLDSSIRMRTSDDRWELALIGKNLTNHLYILGVSDGPLTGSNTGLPTGVLADQVGYAAMPRTVQLQATFRY